MKTARFALLALGLALAGLPRPAPAQQMLDAASPDDWPRTRSSSEGKLTVYQPQIDEWDGHALQAHAACSVQPPGAGQPVFGVIDLQAATQVDRQGRTVALQDVKIRKATFPSSPEKAAAYQAAFQQMVPKAASTMALDQLEAQLAIERAESKGRAGPLKNDPPRILFSKTSAVLVYVDGDPVWSAVKGTSLERVVNTRALLLRDRSGKIYVHVFDGWLEAPALAGPWAVAKDVPGEAERAAKQLSDARTVDLMEGPPDDKDPTKRPTLAGGAPRVVVATSPTELVVTEGEPDWVPVDGTRLLYVKNTTGNVFRDLGDQKTYVLVSGRWFRAASTDGPWEYVPGRKLPPDFARIPDESPKENAKASVPGTPQAQEALIANQIPQTAQVDRRNASFTPHIDGAPDLRPIEGTPLSYVYNSPTPIIEVSPTSWYAVDNGVWFTASAAAGPWAVADSVPPVIYSIPPSSPIHYVTYVRVYDATPDYVDTGYTPGYMGAMVDDDDVVVYGTGYWYPPYIGPDAWYGWPLSYGYGLGLAWTPWTGWGYGFGFGWGWGAVGVGFGLGWCWGAAPWWGAMPYSPYAWGGRFGAGYYGGYGVRPAPPRWGPGGWAATTANVYRRWGPTSVVTRNAVAYNSWSGRAWSSQVGHAYNSRTGVIAAGQRGSVRAIYAPTGRGAAAGGWGGRGPGAGGRYGGAAAGAQARPGGWAGSHYYAGRDGNVYRYDAGSGRFQQYGRDGRWGGSPGQGQAQALQRQQSARQWGAQRSWGARYAPYGGFRGGGFRSGGWGGGGFRGGGGGFRGGGGGFHGGGGGFHGGGGARR